MTGAIYDETHELFRKSVRLFTEREMVPHFERWEEERLVDRVFYVKAGDAGLLGMAVPEEYGGGKPLTPDVIEAWATRYAQDVMARVA